MTEEAAPEKKRACLAIGIGVTQELDDLPGAVTGAEQFAAWAKKAGYETRLVTDATGAVDIAHVRAALLSLLPAPRDGSDHEGPVNPPERLLLYFAGHGMHSGLSSLWILSGTYHSQEAIGVSQIQDMLASYGIGQLAVVSDACLSPAIRDWTVNIVPHAVLPLGPFDPLSQICDVDQFDAVQRFQQAFMLREHEDAPARCIFSGVLMEALHGGHEDLFDPEGRMTSDRLALHLRREVPKTAGRYKVAMTPRIRASWLSPHDVYVERGELAAMDLTPLPPWPDTGTGETARPVRGPNKGLSSEPTKGQAAEQEWADAIRVQKFAATSAEMNARWRADDLELGYLAADRLINPEAECGLSLSGAEIEGLQLGRPTSHAHPLSVNKYAIQLSRSREYSPFDRSDWCLVVLDDGRTLGSCVQQGFATDHLVDARGSAAVVLRPLGQEFAGRQYATRPRSRSEAAITAIAAIEQGELSPDDAADLAVSLREGKHRDPMLGVISAYLYHAVGDVDSIRRMAWFYYRMGQSVPYDIALLARVACHRAPHGGLMASVPDVPEMRPRTESEANHAGYFRATAAVEVPIAGRFPLLRAGWFLLGGRSPDLVPGGFDDIARALGPAVFATMPSEAGRTLAAILKGAEA